MTVCYINPSVAPCADGNFLWEKAALILSFPDDKGSVLMLFLCYPTEQKGNGPY